MKQIYLKKSKLDQNLNLGSKECIVAPQKSWAQKQKNKKNLCRGPSLALGKGGLCRGPHLKPSAKTIYKKNIFWGPNNR
jgi:hypothetical protein